MGSTPGRVQNKVAIVTGGTGGMGVTNARALVAAGAMVVVAARDDARGAALAPDPERRTGPLRDDAARC